MDVTNEMRAEWAREAVQVFASAHYGGIDLSDPGDAHMVLGDLLADLIHWVGVEEFETCAENGLSCYREELAEEAEDALEAEETYRGQHRAEDDGPRRTLRAVE